VSLARRIASSFRLNRSGATGPKVLRGHFMVVDVARTVGLKKLPPGRGALPPVQDSRLRQVVRDVFLDFVHRGLR